MLSCVAMWVKQAYEAAADTLDVITLSSGEFNVPRPISKSIAIYGVGFEDDEATGTQKTYLSGESIELKPSDYVDEDGNVVKAGKRANGVHLEGLHIANGVSAANNNDVPIKNLTIVKCHIRSLGFQVNCSDITIRQSVIDHNIATVNPIYRTGIASNLLVSNCFLGWAVDGFDKASTIKVDHSILHRYPYNYPGSYTYTNNIMFTAPESGAFATNNIFVGCTYNSTGAEANWNNLATAGVFAAEGEDTQVNQNGEGKYTEGKDYALKYPNKYVGNDGTQVGLHGGTYAWNKIPSLPRITEYTLDTSNAAQGTIKVSIKAEAQTKE